MGPDRQQRVALRRLLVAALGSDLTPEPQAINDAAARLGRVSWEALPAAADRQGITLPLRAALDLVDSAPAHVTEDVQSRTLRHRGAHLRALVALERLMPLLDEHAGRWLLYKGLVLSDTVYRLPGRRSFSDIDILVRPQTVGSVLAALETHGARLATRNWKLLRAEGVCELSYVLPNGSSLDLHWGVLGSPRKVPGVRLDAAGMLERARTVTVGGAVGLPLAVSTFDETDQLLHLATHAVLAGMGPLRFCLDIDQAIRHQLPLIQELTDRAAQTRTTGMLELALRRTSHALGLAPKTTQLLSSLQGRSPAWQSTIAAWNAVKPPQSTHERGPMDFVIGATRQSSSASFRELGAAGGRRLAAFRHPRTALQRLASGSHDGTNLDAWFLDIDEGHREALLAELADP